MQYLKFIEPTKTQLKEHDVFMRVTFEDEEGLLNVEYLVSNSNTINFLGMMNDALGYCWRKGNKGAVIEQVEYISPLIQKKLRTVVLTNG